NWHHGRELHFVVINFYLSPHGIKAEADAGVRVHAEWTQEEVDLVLPIRPPDYGRVIIIIIEVRIVVAKLSIESLRFFGDRVFGDAKQPFLPGLIGQRAAHGRLLEVPRDRASDAALDFAAGAVAKALAHVVEVLVPNEFTDDEKLQIALLELARQFVLECVRDESQINARWLEPLVNFGGSGRGGFRRQEVAHVLLRIGAYGGEPEKTRRK